MSLAHPHGPEDASPSPGGPEDAEDAEDAVSAVRSEEHLRAGTVVVESGRVRLRKVVTTEMETVTVPVRREHVVLEELPVGPAGEATAAGAPLSEVPVLLAELVLHEERPTVSTVVVPVERVRLWLETYAETQTVAYEVRQEQVEVTLEEQPGR